MTRLEDRQGKFGKGHNLRKSEWSFGRQIEVAHPVGWVDIGRRAERERA